MRKSGKMTRRVLSWVLTAAMLLGGGSFRMGAAAGEGEISEGYTDPDTGVELTVTYRSDHTAAITKLIGHEATAYTIPGELEREGERYTVDTLKVNYWDSENEFTSLILPDTLTDIGSLRAFSKVKELTIPGSVKEFKGSLQYCDGLEKLVFEEGVEVIDSNSMVSGCSNLKTVVLPSTLKELRNTATFSGAAALESINLPEGVRIEGICTFQNCTSLKTIDLPASVSEIPTMTFQGCSALETVTAQGSITKIGMQAFYNCGKLKSVPNLGAVTEIGGYAFYRCAALSGPLDLHSLEQMGNSVFGGCYALSGNVDLRNLTQIPQEAFKNTNITSVQFGEGLTTIGNSAFEWSGLTTVEFPGFVEEIGANAFATNTLAGKIVLPNSLTKIGEGAFMFSYVTEVVIGNGLTEIPSKLFAYDYYLETVTIDNLPDDVRVAADAFTEGVTVTYTRAPWVEDDKVSKVEGAKTLQEAVNEAKDGEETVLTLQKGIALSQTVTIPKEKNIVLEFASAPEERWRVGPQGDAQPEGLFKIEEGGALTLRGEVSLKGEKLSGKAPMIDCAGELTIEEGVAIENAVVDQEESGVVRVSGENAAFTMKGGVITGTKVKTTDSAPVYVGEGATFTMDGGSITKNATLTSAGNRASAGVFVTEGGAFTLNDGEITNNKGCRGAAVQVNSGGERAYFTMVGGVIAKNVGASISTAELDKGAGAVFVMQNAEFTMRDGEITDNRAVVGGGVCVVDWGLQNNEKEDETTFTMEGGIISGNNASGSGGGIYSYSNFVFLNAGEISGNHATQGGGVYSEGNSKHYSTLHMKNVLITENTARQGGGMWFCPTGEGEIYVSEGVALFGNTAVTEDGATKGACGDDFVSAARKPHAVTLADRMLNGGAVTWYRDGNITTPWPGGDGVLPGVGSMGRYGTLSGDAAKPVRLKGHQGDIALKAVVLKEAARQAAELAELKIVGNSALRGGGVAANGGVITGDMETVEIPVTKVWSGGTARPAVTVELLNDGVVIDRATLSEENNWTHTFTELPREGAYTLRETAVENYTGVVSGDGVEGFTVTNTYAPPPPPPPSDDDDPEYGGLTVTKTVTGSGDKEKKFSFTVTLSANISGKRGEMRFTDGVAKFTLKHGEKKTASGLPVGVKYTVTETAEEGYRTTSEGETGKIRRNKTALAAFVNEKTETPPPTPTPSETPTPPAETPTPTPPVETPPLPVETPTGTPEPVETPAVESAPPESTPVPTETPKPSITPDVTPKTGDGSHLGLWSGLWALSLAGGAALLYKKRKKEQP